jgi:endonuclease YncB( thermonuclease family)
MRRIILASAALFLLIGIVILGTKEPRLDRNWTPDQTIPASAVITGDEVSITNVRNFTYRSTTDYTPGYYDTKVFLSQLESVDYIVEPFGDIGAAHTFLSFGFSDGQRLAISVEIRKEVGESFSPWQGLMREYELMYVIADERDVVALRALHRKHDVYVYPTTATPAEAQKLFVSMINRANALMTKPEFYNTLMSNCTTNIVSHINELRDESISFDHRMILPEHSDALAKELGFIAPDLMIEEARARYRINGKAEAASLSENFSKFIREEISVSDTAMKGVVTEVMDGDTVTVKVGDREYRVRYIGVDTPEMNYDSGAAECLAAEAKDFNETLVLNQTVTLTKDVSETDTYGRLLRYVHTADGVDVGEKLITSGYAITLTIPPDVARAERYRELQRLAQEGKRGLWGSQCN